MDLKRRRALKANMKEPNAWAKYQCSKGVVHRVHQGLQNFLPNPKMRTKDKVQL